MKVLWLFLKLASVERAADAELLALWEGLNMAADLRV